MIVVRELVKKYGSRIALDHLNLEIENQGVIGLLGPNGAGKSTFMQILAGFLVPTEGYVEIDGENVSHNILEIKKQIGYLPEIPPLYLDMSPYEYLDFVGRAKGLKKNELEDAIASSLERTQLVDVKNRLIKTLSKGYRQRVGIAQAILGNPRIIILDEPMVGLDPAQVVEFKSMIQGLSKTSLVLISSHIILSLSEMVDKIIVIDKGKLIASGTLNELRSFEENSDELSLEDIYLKLVGKEGSKFDDSI